MTRLSRESGVSKALLSQMENGRLIPTAMEWELILAALLRDVLADQEYIKEVLVAQDRRRVGAEELADSHQR